MPACLLIIVLFNLFAYSQNRKKCEDTIYDPIASSSDNDSLKSSRAGKSGRHPATPRFSMGLEVSSGVM